MVPILFFKALKMINFPQSSENTLISTVPILELWAPGKMVLPRYFYTVQKQGEVPRRFLFHYRDFHG